MPIDQYSTAGEQPLDEPLKRDPADTPGGEGPTAKRLKLSREEWLARQRYKAAGEEQ